MKSISFVNPLLLLVAIPFFALVLIAFRIAIRKENKTRATVTSLILHLLIVLAVTLGVAGLTYTGVITETEVVVLVDLSDSTASKYAELEGYLDEVEDSMITNSSLAVVAFGKTPVLHTPFGEKRTPLSPDAVDGSDTDIAGALTYAATLFSENAKRRVVLITDARSTGVTEDADVVRAVSALFAMDVHVDALWLDTNLAPEDKEMQITSVDFTKSTYRTHLTTADVLISSSYAGRAILKLYREGELLSVRTESLTEGFNIVNFDLLTEEDGVFEYTVELTPEADITPENNVYAFTQHVSGHLRVLLVTSKEEDVTAARRLLGEDAVIDVYNVAKKKNDISLPYTVPDLMGYDEILISDVDVLQLPNYAAFIVSLDTVVSQFGKSLVTFGNNNIQNETEKMLARLENMLPVSYGNNERDAKLVTFVLDCSKSMNTAGRLNCAREVAIGMLDLLSQNDKVAIIAFYGDYYTALNPTSMTEKDAIADTIRDLTAKQGTVLAPALTAAYEMMRDLDYAKKQAILISDGRSFPRVGTSDDPALTAAEMLASGITVTTVNMWTDEVEASNLLSDIATSGGGTYYYIKDEDDAKNKVETQFADEIRESVIEGEHEVTVALPHDPTLKGLTSLPVVYGYTYSKIKPGADTVLTVQYERASGVAIPLPLFAHWEYGNGAVSTYASSLSGAYSVLWQEGVGELFFQNVLQNAIPKEKIDHPYNLNVTERGSSATVELIPYAANPDAKATLTLTTPSGETLTFPMTFAQTKYECRIPTDARGLYTIDVTYAYADKAYAASTTLNVSYSEEYDRFTLASPTVLYNALGGRGEVGEGSVPTYEYDEGEITAYVYHFEIPLFLLAAVLFVLDVIVRKLKWDDLTHLFRKIKKG